MDGFSGRILLDLRTTPTWDNSLPVLTELNCSEDLTIPGPAVPMIKSKGRKYRDVAAYFHGSQMDCVLQVSVIIDPADTAYVAVKNAIRNKTKLTLYIADDLPSAGDKLDRGEFFAFTPERTMTGNEEAVLNVTFAPALGTEHPLHEFTWPSGS